MSSEKPNKNVNVKQPEKDPDAKHKKRLSPFVWVPGLFIIVVILWWLIRWLQHRGSLNGYRTGSFLTQASVNRWPRYWLAVA